MNFRIDRKPTFPTGTAFLNSWTIQRPVFCVGAYEVYRIQGGSEILFGLVIRCRKREEALEQSKQHLTWWRLQGEDRIEVLANDIRMQGEWYLVLACIAIQNKIVLIEELGTTLLTQVQAESLIIDLIALCKLAHTHSVNPVIEIGSVLLVKHKGGIKSIPLFVKISDLPAETEAVESIAKIVYFFTTGIDTSTFTSIPSNKRTTPPPASRWNKNIDHGLSSLLGSCLDSKDPQRVISLSDFEIRLSHFSGQGGAQTTIGIQRNQESVEHLGSKTSKGLAKVAGMSALKELLIEEVVHPIKEPEPYKRYGLTIPNGILLFGPPGCGKTFIARQLAEELDFYFLEIIPSEIASPYIHHTVLKIRDIFETSEQHTPSIVFIDEFEAFVPSRSELGGHQQYKSEEVNEFLVHLNGCASKNIFVLAATNEPDKIDGAILRPGRMDKMIYVGPPDMEARIELLKMYLSHRPLGNVEIEKFARLLEGYSCSDIRNICDEAARLAFKQDSLIENEHLSEAIHRNPSSLSVDVLLKYEKLQQRGI